MSDWLHVDVKVIRRETDKAFQLIYGNGLIGWVPKSVVADADDYEAGERDFLMSLKSWFCEKEGIGEKGPEAPPEREPGEEG